MAGEPRPKSRTFSFNISFGKKPPLDDARLADMLDDAVADAAASPDGQGSASWSEAIDRATGQPVPLDDPRVQELLKRARADAEQSPDGIGLASDAQTYRLDVKEGLELIGDLLGGSPRYEDSSSHVGEAEDPKAAREREMWDRLHLIAQGKGAYPDTRRWHQRLSMATTIIAISLPLAALILTVATRQSLQTVVYVTFGAAFIAIMFRSSIR